MLELLICGIDDSYRELKAITKPDDSDEQLKADDMYN